MRVRDAAPRSRCTRAAEGEGDERRLPIRRLRHAHHGADRSLRKISRPGFQAASHIVAAPDKLRKHRYAPPTAVVFRRRTDQQRREYLAIQPDTRTPRL